MHKQIHRTAANCRTGEGRDGKRVLTSLPPKKKRSAAFAQFAAVNLGFAVLGISAFDSQSALATNGTWANASPTTPTLTTTTTGGVYTSSTTLAVGDAVLPGSSAGGLTKNDVYYVVNVTGSNYTLSATPGGAAITGTTTGGTAVASSGLYTWDATAATDTQGAASWNSVPNGTDAVATVASNSAQAGVPVAIKDAETIGVLNLTANTTNAALNLISSSSGSTTSLSALTFATTSATPAGPTISTSSNNELIRLGLLDASFNQGKLKIDGNQGLTLIATGTAGYRIDSVDWSGFTDSTGTTVGTLTVQQGAVSLQSGGNVLGSGTSAINFALGNASSTAAADVTLVAGQTVNILSGTSNGRISGAFTLTVGAGNGTGGNYAGTIGQNAAGTNTNTNLLKTGSGTETISGTIFNAGTVAVNGASGALVLTNSSNTYTGATTITAGTLVGIGSNAFGSTSGINIAGSGILALHGDTSTSFVLASNNIGYAVTTTASGATINADEATVSGSTAKAMTIGTLGTTYTGTTYQVNFTGADNTSLNIGAVTGPASTALGTTTLANAIASGGTLTLASYTSGNTSGGESLVFNGTGNTTVGGAINQNGANILGLTYSGSGVLTLNGSSSYSGITTISSGTLRLGNVNALGTSVLGASATFTGTLDVNGNAISNLIADKALNGGTITNSGAAVNLTGMGSISASATRAFFLSGTGNMTFGQQIANNYAITKNGSNTVIFSGSNTYNGGTTIAGGTLNLGSASAIGAAGTVSFTGGTLQYSSANNADYSSRFSSAANQLYSIDTNSQTVTYSSALTSSGGSLTKYGLGTLICGTSSSYTNGTTVSEGIVTDSAGGVSGAFGSGNITVSPSGSTAAQSAELIANANTSMASTASVTVSNNASANGTIVFNSAAPSIASLLGNGYVELNGTSGTALTVGTAGNPSFSGVISDAGGSPSTGSLTVTGSGTFTLSGPNTFGGGTTISGATLLVNNTSGSGTGGGSVSVNAGIVAGTGTISGSIAIAAGATLSPGIGGAANTLTTGAVTSNGTGSTASTASNFSFAINSNTGLNDELVSSGVVALGSGISLLSVTDLGNTTLTGPQTFVLINAAGGVTGTFAGVGDNTSYTVGANTYTINYDQNSGQEVTLTISTTPEPAALWISGLTGLALMRRRRHAKP